MALDLRIAGARSLAVTWAGFAADALAQGQGGPLSFLELPEPTPLPGSPLLTRLLFENPLPLTLILLVAALVLYVVFNSRAKYKQGLVAAGLCVLAAGGVWVTAAIVQTDHEKLRATARELTDAVATADVGELEDLLGPDARLSSVPTLGEISRHAIIEAVRANLGPGKRFEVDEHSIQEIQTAVDGPRSGRVQLRVRVQVKQMGYPNISWWALGFSLGDDGTWRVISIRALAIRGIS